jgi:cysteine desulfurase/selenocysteine lyase
MERNAFPLLRNFPDLAYLDTAATSLKPASVIEAEAKYAECFGTNAARGLYPLAESTSAEVERIRHEAARFFGASPEETIFTSGTTAGINQAARLLAPTLERGHEILVSVLEHHSNFLPWKALAREKKAPLSVIPATREGFIEREALKKALGPDTRVVALSAASNVLGGAEDIPALSALIRSLAPEAVIVVDAAQLAGKRPFSFSSWDVDIVALSGHKMYAPTGTGLLFIERNLQDRLGRVSLGGGMVEDALAEPARYKQGPEGFEAGTLNLGGIFGFGAALEFLDRLTWEAVAKHDEELVSYALSELRNAFGGRIEILGTEDPKKRLGILSFTLRDVHPHDLAAFSGERHVAFRAGEHCAAPLHRSLGLPASSRLSFGVYTEKKDIDQAVAALKEAVSFFAV